MAEWILEEAPIFARKFRWHQKKHPHETHAALNNLDTYLTALNSGVKPPLIQAGFIHREPQGVIAIDQKAGKGNLKQTRLYIYAVEVQNTVYLITIADKKSQGQDLKDCRKFVTDLRKEG